MQDSLTITTPDDWHLHLRDNQTLATTVPHAADRLDRAIIMPNLAPPVTSVALATAYKQRIVSHIPTGKIFEPLMTLYLTSTLTPEHIEAAKQAGIVAVKYYPQHATTNSAEGVSDLFSKKDTLASMAEHGMPLLCHGELNEAGIDVFDRERAFIEQVLAPLQKQLPTLKIVLEHITTAFAVNYVITGTDNTAATITAHHLLLNRNDMLGNGIKPHYYCMPILKRHTDQQALIEAATSGHPRFFMGTDSAPHSESNKLQACGCAGIYTAHASIELYAQIFEQANALPQLENFCSRHGPAFYQLPMNNTTITLKKLPWQIPEYYPYDTKNRIVPFGAGQIVDWQLIEK